MAKATKPQQDGESANIPTDPDAPMSIQEATTAALVDYDIFQVRPNKVQKQDPRTRQQWTEIEYFELYRLKKSTRVEPHLAKDLNAFAEGIPTNNDFGELFLPKGKYKEGDRVRFSEVYPEKSAEENMYRVIPQGQA